jgi:hypothetical protein
MSDISKLLQRRWQVLANVIIAELPDLQFKNFHFLSGHFARMSVPGMSSIHFLEVFLDPHLEFAQFAFEQLSGQVD